MIAFALEPVVLNVTAPVNALVAVSKVMVALLALVVKLDTPLTLNAPLSLIFPVVAVALKSPPTVTAAKARALSLMSVASPLPWVVSVMLPSTASVFMLMRPLAASVVAVKSPPTVMVPLSVIPAA